ncbi:MAG: hypothetical protein ACRDA4_04680 [Filifactoraceae bacterium]
MNKDDCSRRTLLLKELINDWDELNIAFKSLIFIGFILFIIIICISFLNGESSGIRNSLEVVFRSTLSSIFGFLFSSNIKFSTNEKIVAIESVQTKLYSVQDDLDSLEKVSDKEDDNCQLSKKYTYVNINLVQICIAVSICLLCMIVICALLLTDSLDNVPAVSQIRDLMCSSIGFLLGESKKK